MPNKEYENLLIEKFIKELNRRGFSIMGEKKLSIGFIIAPPLQRESVLLKNGKSTESFSNVFSASNSSTVFIKFKNYQEFLNREFLVNLEYFGYVKSLDSGVANVTGLQSVTVGELVEFSVEVGSKIYIIRGMVLNLEANIVKIILFSDEQLVSEGSLVFRSGNNLTIPVGEELLGRVVDPIGRILDNKKKLINVENKLIEVKAPGIIERKSVGRPMQTGIKTVDSLFPIGRGQRELIIGDRQTGKTAILIDSILNQKVDENSIITNLTKKVFCVYVAVGQKMSTIKQIYDVLEAKDALKYTVLVVTSAADAASLQYLAPYAGCAIGEFFRDTMRDSLILYDDLSKQAVAYRQMSLILRRPPGREAYPGDVFYLHSKLLERAAQLSVSLGTGSLTALPVVETQAGDISAYIPTNVISITDGQIFLETDLFFRGVRPAISLGLSVSRVGSAAQQQSMREINKLLKADLAQYNEVATFARFGAEMDDTTAYLIRRGSRLIELLKQRQFVPYNVNDQVWSLFAGISGLMDYMHLENILEFEKKLLGFVNNCSIVEPINEFSFFNLKADRHYFFVIVDFVKKFEKIL